MLPTTKPKLTSTPTSDIPHPTSRFPSLAMLSGQDRQRLSLLFRTRGDAVSFAHLREEDPLETLLWLDQPHIKPWHEAIRAAHREHEALETHASLMRALKDITRILDLEADSTLRIRAVNAIIKLANAIHRSGRTRSASEAPPSSRTQTASNAPPSSRARSASEVPSSPLPAAGRAGVGLANGNDSPARTAATPIENPATELTRAHDAAENALYVLKFHQERRDQRKLDLKDANAPVGTHPSWAKENEPNNTAPAPLKLNRASINTPASGRISVPMTPLSPMPPTSPARRPHLNGTHRAITARAGTPRPPSDRPPPRKRKRH